MIESELEVQFKLLEYLVELHHASAAKTSATNCLKVVEQMRVVHD